MKPEIMTSSVEMNLPMHKEFGPRNMFSPIQHKNGNTFTVWVDEKLRPQVSHKLFNGQVVTVPLDPNPDYTVEIDGHHAYSLGIDDKGYIHIAGDMHNYPMDIAVNRPTPIPERYKYQYNTCMNWVSNKPNDVSGGFKFVGAKNSNAAIPIFSGSYVKFHHSRKGHLFATALTRAYLNPMNGFTPGSFGLGLYKYCSCSQTWQAIGELPPVVVPNNGPRFPVVFWENAGTGNWFQGYIPGVYFDLQDRMHLGWASNVDIKIEGNSVLYYAMSPDYGKTWFRANETQIPNLPLRGIASEPSCADIVYDAKVGKQVEDFTTVSASADGTPMVSNKLIWRTWNGQNWATAALPGVRSYCGQDRVNTLIDEYRYITRHDSLIKIGQKFDLINVGMIGIQAVSDLGFYDAGTFVGHGICQTDPNVPKTFPVIRVDFKLA